METETKTEPSSVEELLSGDPAQLTKPIKAVEDKWNLVPAFLKVTLVLLMSGFAPLLVVGSHLRHAAPWVSSAPYAAGNLSITHAAT